MGDVELPSELPIVDDDDGFWMSPGAARKFRRRAWGIAAFILLLGVNAVVAWDARDNALNARDELRREQTERIMANTLSNYNNCKALDSVAAASKAVVAGTGASLEQADVAKISDQQLRAFIQNIVDRSAANQQHLRDLGDAIPIIDCEAQAKRAGGLPAR